MVCKPFPDRELSVEWLQVMDLPRSPLTHWPLRSMYTSMGKVPSTCTVMYEAGMDWRKVEVGVTGDRKDSVSLAGLVPFIEGGAGM